MPESDSALEMQFAAAVSVVERQWRRLLVSYERLTPKQLMAYQHHAAALGWRIPLQFADQTRRVDVLVARGFPSAPARIALVDRPNFLTWPHVEKDGVLCLLADHSTVSVDDPYGGVVNLLDAAIGLVDDCAAGRLEDHFRSEFLSYWSNVTTSDGAVLSLLRPSSPSRVVKWWESPKKIVVAEDETELRRWLQNYGLQRRSPAPRLHDGMFVWLDQVPLPSDYPQSSKDVYDIVEHAGAADLLDRIAERVPERILAAFGARSDNGPVQFATVISRPPIRGSMDPLTKGFRAAVPKHIFNSRYFGALSPRKSSVDRIDPEWIHGRCQDQRFSILRGSTVAILGCGSIGAPVAFALARAGVGHLILVDIQTLSSANLGRHPLGASDVGEPKATALSRRIRGELPHVVVDAHVAKAESLLLRPDSPLLNANVIVSAMGNWATESLLDRWHDANKRPMPIVYGWTETHAAAGHAVVIASKGASFSEGVDATGVPKLVATQWPESTQKQEPACGAVFEPYGPVELGYVTSMIAEAATDCVLGRVSKSAHRLWLARRDLLEAAGGKWTAAVGKESGFRPEGAVMVERSWGAVMDAKTLAA